MNAKRILGLAFIVILVGVPLLGLLQSPPEEVNFGLRDASQEFMTRRDLDVSTTRTIADLQIDRDKLTLTINRSYDQAWEAEIDGTSYVLAPGQGPYVLPLPDEPGMLANALVSLGFALAGTAALVAVTRIASRSH